MELTVEPEAGLVDEPVTWRVHGPGAPTSGRVRLRMTGSDAAGRRWNSESDYSVSGAGRLLVDDPDVPWTSMTLVPDGASPVAFSDPDDVWTCTAIAGAGSHEAQAEVRRVYRSGVTRSELAGSGWRLEVFGPTSPVAGAVAVLVVPGSTGASAMAPTAALLASRGHPSAVLSYAQEPGLPASMRAIPVEVVGEALEAFGGLGVVDSARVVLWAVSVGTGLALSAVAGPGAPRPRGVVAMSPTDVVRQALAADGRPPRASSLSRGGTELPYVPMHGERLLGQVLRHALLRRLPGPARSTAMRLYPAYDRRKDDPAVVEAATIPVEDIAAPMLLVAGGADAMWPSATTARAIARRRRDHGVGADDRLVVLTDAGHFMRPPATPSTVDRTADLVSGGTPDGIARGKRSAWSAALSFLGELSAA